MRAHAFGERWMVESFDRAGAVSQLRPARVQDLVVAEVLDVPGIESLGPEWFLAGDDLDAPSGGREEGLLALGAASQEIAHIILRAFRFPRDIAGVDAAGGRTNGRETELVLEHLVQGPAGRCLRYRFTSFSGSPRVRRL